MKISLQYLSDSNGKTKAVQMPLTEWEKVLSTIKRYELSLKIKSDLAEAFKEVSIMKKRKAKKQTLKDFVNGL